MPSGKQTSFQYGEVAPIQHYRSNDAAYSNALHSLHNMYVRRTGGVSRMPGTKLSSVSSNQENTPESSISYQRYKMFSFPILSNNVRSIGLLTLHIKDPNTGEVTIEVNGTSSVTAPVFISDDLSSVMITRVKDSTVIHGLKSDIDGVPRFVMASIALDDGETIPNIGIFRAVELPALTVTPPGSTGNLTSSSSLATAVQYLIMYETSDGVELPVLRFETDAYDDNGFPTTVNAGSLIMPGDGVMTGFNASFDLSEPLAARVTSINIYRAPVTDSASAISGMILVFKMPQDTSLVPNPPDSGATFNYKVVVNDTGASSPLVTPPVDYSMFTNYGGDKPLEGTSCSTIYQGRLVIGFNIFNNPNISEGAMAVSRVGGPFQISRPIISRNTEAFGMSIPVDDGSPVRQLITAERLIALSDNGTYVIQGGDSGILTPTTVNPYKISTEGGSKTVPPTIAGTNAIYLNATHTKIMMIVFGPQSQAGVLEISSLSDHLLEGEEFIEIIQMPGVDRVILALKQNGSLISITISETNIAGFSQVDMAGGLVESMALSGSSTKEYLILSVVRNGIRTLETIGDDQMVNSPRLQAYSGAAAIYGSRLLKVTEQGYPTIPAISDGVIDPENYITYEYLNITTGSDYLAGSTLTITSDAEIGDGFTEYDTIKVFFEENGEERYLYLTLLDSGTFTTVWTYTARADIDVPEYLQDVEGNGALSAQEKLRRSSRWLKAFTRVDGSIAATGLGALTTLLESLEVSVVADGKIYSSPLNPHMHTLNIDDSGANPVLDIPEPVTYVEIGIPYESYMQTLPIEVGDGRTLTDDKKIVDKVGIALYNTVGGFLGLPNAELRDMAPVVTRDDLNLGNPDLGFSGYTAPIMPSQWTKEGMIKIRQVDSMPMTILSVYPKGLAGD